MFGVIITILFFSHSVIAFYFILFLSIVTLALLIKNKEIKIRIGEKEEVVRADQPSGILNKGLAQLICTVIDQYAYLLM